MKTPPNEPRHIEDAVRSMLDRINEVDEKGFIERMEDGSYAVMIRGQETDIVDDPKARCLNPEAEAKAQVYLRFFLNKGTQWENKPESDKDVMSDDISKLPAIPSEGYIERLPDGKTTVILAKGAGTSVLNHGAVCLNPEAPETERIYRKVFKNKKIYLPNEYEDAYKFLHEPNTFVISANGFTTLKPETLQAWGLEQGEYEAGVYDLIGATIQSLRDRFRGIKIRVVDGGSDLGVDSSLLRAEADFGVESLSFSCPRWAFYAPDEAGRMFVASTSDEYADRYIHSLDFLLATGGRDQALKHDIRAAILYSKRMHFVDVAGLLSRNGGVPATVTLPDGTIKIENAAAAMGRYISFAQSGVVTQSSPNEESWEGIVDNVKNTATDVCFGMRGLKMTTKFRHRGNHAE